MRKIHFWVSLMTVVVFICSWVPVSWTEDTKMININIALAEELMQLKGIGEKKAETIIQFRENNGPFKVPEDLMKVPGIGPKTFEANKGRIVAE